MTADQAIEQSIRQNETVYLDHDPDVMIDLAVECEGHTDDDTGEDYWGTDEDGCEWRVHVARGGR